MGHPTLFHLHFNTPDVEGAADRLAQAGVPLQRRFGSLRGEGRSLEPGEEIPDEFRFKLQVHQRGSVNITLAPGQRPRFDHLGLIVDEFEAVLGRAEGRDWSVRRDERRPFVMTPWGFRVEVHSPDGDVVRALGESTTLQLENTVLQVPEPDAVRAGLTEVFGETTALQVEPGERPWIPTFTVGNERESREVDVDELLGG